MKSGAERATFGEVMRHAEYRWLYIADMASVLGDQLARVALSILVFGRTGSAVLAATAMALTYLPTIIGGTVLAGWADRYPRRSLLIVCDFARVLLVAAMAIPGLHYSLVFVLLCFLTLLGGPARAAGSALMPDLLPPRLYLTASGYRNLTLQFAALGGFTFGGVLTAFTGPQLALLIDAATFALSGLLIWFGVKHRNAPAPAADDTSRLRRALAGAELVWRDRGARSLIALYCLWFYFVATEALGAPMAAATGNADSAVGWVMAAHPVGMAIGIYAVTRLTGDRLRRQLIGPAAVLGGLPLLACFGHPPLWLVLLAYVISGVLVGTSNCALGPTLNIATPADKRGRVMGFYMTVGITIQGLGALLAGTLADHLGAGTAVALMGGFACVTAFPLARAWANASRANPSRWLGNASDD